MTTELAEDLNYLKEVREQYETYPYPLRDPAHEKTSFDYLRLCALDVMNYYHFSGKRDFAKNFRVLIAGGGTGDEVIMLAEQLRELRADIIYLDISQASMKMAKDRAKIRKLTNITWIHGSILDVPRLLEGQFDFISCSGVLHHLESPEAGLAALTSVLKDDGVIGLMLYAKYGREVIYQTQRLMRIINSNERNIESKLENCKRVLKNLPLTNFLKSGAHPYKDLTANGDAGIFDLLLHSNDVAYSVPELYEFLAGSELELTHFFFDHHPEGNNLYRLEYYIKDNSLSRVINHLTLEQKQAAAELMHGQMIKHNVYASKTKAALPSLDDLDNVPSLSIIMGTDIYPLLYNMTKLGSVGQIIAYQAFGLQIGVIKTANLESILKNMDGIRSMEEIFTNVISSYPANEKKPTLEELKEEFKAFFSAFNLHDWMFLRNKSVPRVKTVQEILNRS